MSGYTKIYPSENSEASNVSIDFSADTKATLLVINGLGEDDCAKIEFFIDEECTDGNWLPFRDCCGQVKIDGDTCGSNFMVLPIPLRYRVFLTNVDDNHLTNPDWFENVTIWYKKLPTTQGMEQFFHSCCCDEKEQILTNIALEINRVANKIYDIHQTLK